MDKHNHLDELPIADLTDEQLALLQSTENSINKGDDEDVYIIAFKRRPS